ncbi:MAG: EpsG family protein, partial [bacterium]
YLKSYNLVSPEAFFSATQSRMEIGYVIYMRVIALLGFSYLGFQIITSALILFSLSRFIYKYSNNVAFSFFVFMTTRMFFATMNISRQYLAVAILLFTVEFIREGKFIKFSLLVLVASSFHFTAIIFLIAYPLVNLKLNAKKTILLIGGGIINALLFDQMVKFFVAVTGRYAGYLEGGYFNFESNFAIYLNLGINLLFFLVAFLTKYWKSRLPQKYNIKTQSNNKFHNHKISDEQLWYTFCLLTLILSIIGINATILSRVEAYFSVFFLTFIPRIIKHIKSKELRAIVTLGIIAGLFASFVVVMVFRPYWTTVFPYQWYWNW